MTTNPPLSTSPRGHRTVFRLRCLLLFGFLLSVGAACTKPGDVIDPDKQSPPPAGVGGQWSYGTFSPTNFWGTDGSVGAAYEQAVAYEFGPRGTYEQYTINTTNYYGCRTNAFSYIKGKAKFNEDDQSIVLTPTEGTQRGEYSCAARDNFKRPANASELALAHKTLYYAKTTNTRGQSVLRLSSESNPQGIELTAGNW